MKISEAFRLRGYRPSKAAQIAAFFTGKSGAHIEKLKLIKLIYLSERESMKRRARPMIYDEMYSLQHGPICSNALNGINGTSDPVSWSRWVRLHGSKDVKLKAARPNIFPEISESDREILEAVWDKFGSMSSAQIRKWTHDNCPEYTEIDKGRIPINYKDVFEALGYENAAELEDTVSEYRRLEAALES